MLSKDNLPKHVAIIMDGNGRWAKSRGKNRVQGHIAGVETLREVVRYSSDIGIKTLSVYAFSTENWTRPSFEVQALMNLIITVLGKEMKKLHKENVKIYALGATEDLPEQVQKTLRNAEELTKDNTGLVFQIAVNYGSRTEIINAVNNISKSGIIIHSEEEFASHLWSRGGDVDLLIRTSGELRLSNFLLWQCAYAEFVFIPEYWPDFTIDVYNRALEEYFARNRRFGGI